VIAFVEGERRLRRSSGDFAACFFSTPGRRLPEGSDEGATLPDFGELAPSSRCRDLLPGGEKKQAEAYRFIGDAMAQG